MAVDWVKKVKKQYWWLLYENFLTTAITSSDTFYLGTVLATLPPLRSQQFKACGRRQLFKTCPRKTSHSSSRSSLTHWHGRGPMKEDRLIENSSFRGPSYYGANKGRKRRLNVGQWYIRKLKPVGCVRSCNGKDAELVDSLHKDAIT